ncbi:tetratricopeptide repeat protein 27-like isoform X2 [Gordionus sp. m RMFG-2023]|uniref:tetratricopeptide repeat protein 27-like isoform X2 n=1 Tax=Gordionus sp. m RMFG-2023 TaxID=3053472 RepID=UPI0031FBE4F7
MMTYKGALGKRTKFQKHDIAQLLLRVKRKGTLDSHKYFDSDTEDSNNKMLPKDIFLDDDTLLDKIAYSATGAHPEPNPNLDQSPENAGNDLIDSSILVITNMERLILLATVRHINLLYPNDPLLFEQIQPYLDLILAPTLQSKSRITWSIKFSTLYQRCLCEVENKRKIESALTQVEELVDNLEGDGKIDKHPIIPNENRMNMFYASGPPPSYYKLQKFLARILLKLGCVSSGLDIFESLNMTADKISCYMALGRMDTAEKTILDWILKRNADASNIENGSFYKLMEDIKDPNKKLWKKTRLDFCQSDIKFYNRDNQKNLLKANNDKESKDVIGDADNRAFANCFKRSLILEPDNFKAWNNLASLQIKSENFVGTCATLKESLKYNYHRSWQIWENLLYVATRRLDCEEMIWCLNSLLDILWGHEGVADNNGSVEEFVFDVNKAFDNDGSPTSYNRFKGQSLTVLRLFPRTLHILVKELAMSTYSNKERNSPDDGGSSLIKPACIAQFQSMKRKLKTLFERETNKLSDNPKIWYLYGLLNGLLNGLLMLTFNKFGNDGYESPPEDLSEKYQAAEYIKETFRNHIAKTQDASRTNIYTTKPLIASTYGYRRTDNFGFTDAQTTKYAQSREGIAKYK